MRLTVFFICCMVQIQGQTGLPEPIKLEPTLANFQRMMSIGEPSSRQMDSIIQLSIAYSFSNEDTCLMLGKRSVEISEQHEDISVYAKALLELGDSYRIFGNLAAGAKLLEEGKTLYETLGNSGQVATANNKLGALNVNQGNFEVAIKYYLSALEIWEDLRDSQNIIKPYINIGVVFRNLNQPEKAISYYDKALEWADILDDDRAKTYVFNNQAIIYNDQAVAYQKQAEANPAKREIFKDSVQFFSHKALNNYENALLLARKNKDKRSIVRALGNMIDLKTTMGQYQEAIDLSKEAESIATDIGEITSIVLIKVNQAETYRYLGQLETSAKFGEKAIELSERNALDKHSASANEQLYLTYKQLNQLDKALHHHEALNAYQQENGAVLKNKAIAEVEAKFQNAQQEKRILTQKNSILELEKKNAIFSRQRNYLIGGGFFIGILSFLGFKLNQIRKERNDKKAFAEALMSAQEEERKRIAQDLHDGVGQSLLLIKKQLESSHQNVLQNQEMITETLEEVRSISRDLHPFQLEKFGLTASVNDIIQKIGKSTELFITKEIDTIDNQLSDKAEINLYRTIQEALSNIVKHAKASAAKVRIHASSGEIRVIIQDNGVGFDHEPAVITSKSLGLRTMHERISAIGGRFKIAKGASKGTIIEIKIPV